MSGGSYDYLCHQFDMIDLDNLEDMATRLAELAPNSAAARDTAELLDRLRGDVTSASLRQVWHDVEWFDSGDYGADQAQAAIEHYEHHHHTEEGQHDRNIVD